MVMSGEIHAYPLVMEPMESPKADFYIPRLSLYIMKTSFSRDF